MRVLNLLAFPITETSPLIDSYVEANVTMTPTRHTKGILDPFSVDFSCTSRDGDLEIHECSLINATIWQTLGLIAAEIQINQTISIKADYMPLCPDQDGCNRLGAARPGE